MTLPTVPIGIVGFGSIARSHLSALRALPVTRTLPFEPVVAVIVSSRPEEVRADAEALGIARVTGSLDEALAEGVALVDVASRNDQHAEQSARALSAGRALYVEKPIGRTVEEARRLAALAARAPEISQPGLVLRYEPAIVEARALVRLGAIGQVVHGRTHSFHGSYLDPSRPISWRLRSSTAGGGAMLDLGVHLIDALRWTLGAELVVRRAAARTVVPRRPDPAAGAEGTGDVDVDDWSWAELDAGGAARITVEASRVALGGEGMRFELDGTEGSIVVDLESGHLALHRFDGRSAAYRSQAAVDPEVRAVTGLRPPVRLSLGSFVDLHAAALHHLLLRMAGTDPAPGLAPSLADAAAAEATAHRIVEMASTEDQR